MKKNKSLIKGIAIGIVFLFIGIIVIQSTGSSNRESSHMSMNPNDFLHTETCQNEKQNNSVQTASDNNEIDSDFTDSTIIAFLDKVTHRYPLFKKMGKEMGLTEQGVSETIKNLGDDNTIKIYISFFSKILGL